MQTPAAPTNWLELIAKRGLDLDALAAGDGAAVVELDRYVAELAERAADEDARRADLAKAWSGTQAAKLAALAAEAVAA